ncbi:MAG TPA: ATP-binding protein, partial [Treponemataceae bacterium]|nr:ATP-binding protein [Treponemataceae bacterium]
ESNASVTASSGGEIYTTILRDIASQLEIEQNLTRAKIAAENANRLKTEFLANMSHELRTPLNAVLGYTQLLDSDRNLTPGQHEKISIISRSGEHLLSLINDILDISKIEAGKIELHESVFSPERFVEDLREMFTLRCQKKNLGLYIDHTGPLPAFVRGDLGKLRQVLINLIGNAVKFTREGGIAIIVGMDSGKLRFSVTDSGKGIPPEELEIIMQPFTQSSITDNEGGTGLGLAISSRYIQMMGGVLEVQSEVGKGSTFTFAVELPETDEVPGETVQEAVPVAVKKGSEVAVLIVDDKELNRMVLKEMLESAGFSTLEAVNGAESVERAREFRPRIIFMDIKMPVMDGYQAVHLLKADANTNAIPVFALTASAFVNDEQKILDSGFDGFLAKPFKKSALFRLIAEKAGVEMEYEAAPSRNAEKAPSYDDADFARAAGILGTSKIERLGEAVLINDFTAVRALADSFPAELDSLAALIRWYADSFDEDGLGTVVGKLEKQGE